MTPAESEKVRSGMIAIAHPFDAHRRKCTPALQLMRYLLLKKVGIDLAHEALWVMGDLDRAIELGGQQALNQSARIQNLWAGGAKGLRFSAIACPIGRENRFQFDCPSDRDAALVDRKRIVLGSIRGGA